MAALIDQIIGWAQQLQLWEQCTLDKLRRGAELDDADYTELSWEFLQEAGIAAVPIEQTPIQLGQPAALQPEPAKCSLDRIFNLQFVNALPAGQELRFGKQLTLIFGENGAGKSGYARLLGCAAFARGERIVLPNAKLDAERGVPQADIEISWGQTKQVLHWTNGTRCPELRGFYLFDSNSMHVHLAEPNALGFAPAGLGILTSLAEATDIVREKIREFICSMRIAPNSASWFTGTSTVTRFLDGVTANTKPEEIERQGHFTPGDQQRIDDLEKAIAQLKAQDQHEHLALREGELRDLEALLQALQATNTSLGEETVREVTRLLTELDTRRDEARQSGSEQFKFQPLPQTGTEQWVQFIRAAKILADSEAARGEPYPKTGDHCLLCRQVLPSDAAELIMKMWEFLNSDSQGQLHRAETACAKKARELGRLELGYFDPNTAARRLVERELPVLVPAIESYTEALSERRQQMMASLTRGEIVAFAPLPCLDASELDTIIRNRQEEIAQLKTSDPTERIQRIRQELYPLEHRRTFSAHVDEVKKYARNLSIANKAEASLGSTRHITAKYGELFRQTVTQRYVDVFSSILQRFGCRMAVTIDTRGHKGETLRIVSLKDSAYEIDQVLSDGEKTAVALADFLTEATLDDSGGGIILDDPVTSLDNKWKATLAQCLAECAAERQVVVFTHDLAFLYRLMEHALSSDVEVLNNWIQDENGQPGFIYANNSPACEKDYKSAAVAVDCYSKAKNKPPEEQQSWLQQGFGALRASYEALVVFGLFNGVVTRFEERIKFDALKDVQIGPEDVEEIVKRMSTLSRYIVAHLHSDTFALSKPTPEMLLQEIQAFEATRKKLKAKRQLTIKKPLTFDEPAPTASESDSRLKAG
ncbi:MAG TPA: AAA family ATPase [Candidatus Acidoferrum sp.]|nr:AAA family ATPase [Candidatus Acidoferrum sp.]